MFWWNRDHYTINKVANVASQVHNDILNNIMLYMTLFKTTFNDAYYMDYKTFRAILNLRIDMENKKEKLQKEFASLHLSMLLKTIGMKCVLLLRQIL